MAITRLFTVNLVALIATMLWATASAQTRNGFDISNATVPADEILRGGPPKDGIPALMQPDFVSTAQVDSWQPDGRMLVVDHASGPRAYPVGILNWHEIVNYDGNGDPPALITFCPLCGTGMVFDPIVDGQHLTFGVSGLLYNSDLLMYDHQSESLWSQIEGKAIAGPMTGTTLERIPTRYTTWEGWQDNHPQAHVLSTDTGYSRNYQRSPYGDYNQSERTFFPVSASSQRYHPKTFVIGFVHNGEARVWPFPELQRSGDSLNDEVGGKPVTVRFDDTIPNATLTTREGEVLPATQGFWFAWYAFHPETSVYTAPAGGGQN